MHFSTLVYTSRATTPVTAHSLRCLAKQSADMNATRGVTGLLLYGSGYYFQVLEGNILTVVDLYEHISKDKRHADCKKLCEHERNKRLFPGWHMGQLNLDNEDMCGQNNWELISSTLASAGTVDWQPTDPVIEWVREFMEHNGGKSSAA